MDLGDCPLGSGSGWELYSELGTGNVVEGYVSMYQKKWNNLSDVLNTAVDSGVVHSDQKAIWTTWRVSMEALDETSRCAIRAVAMLGREKCRSLL